MSYSRIDEGVVTVDLDIVDIRGLAPYADALSGKLCPERLRKMNGYLRAEDRLRCLGGGLLMRRALGTDDVSPNQYGKPTLSPEWFSPNTPRQFNLSHSGNYVALAVCDVTVGVDIEEMLELEYAKLADVCFHADERALLENAPESDKRLLFYKLWTLKESYAKAVGMGLSIAPDSFAISPDDCGGASLRAHPEYRFSTGTFMDDYALSVCTVAPRGLCIARHELHASDFIKLK